MSAMAQAIKHLPVYGQSGGTSTAPIRKEPTVAKIDKLRTAAQHYPCVLCGADKRFTVAAHGNDVADKGIGKTAPGYALAYLCNTPDGCHAKVDGRAGKLPKAEKRALWNEAHRRTVRIWFRDNLVQVA